MKRKLTLMHFRVDTPQLLSEIADCAIDKNTGVLRVPLNAFRILILQISQRAIELNDPILNKIMFDLNLYDLPKPDTPEYGKLMKKVYALANKQIKLEKSIKPLTHERK